MRTEAKLVHHHVVGVQRFQVEISSQCAWRAVVGAESVAHDVRACGGVHQRVEIRRCRKLSHVPYPGQRSVRAYVGFHRWGYDVHSGVGAAHKEDSRVEDDLST